MGVCLQVREKGSKCLKKSREFYVFSVLLNALFKRERKNLRNTTQSGREKWRRKVALSGQQNRPRFASFEL
jgi:hypothetical protein